MTISARNSVASITYNIASGSSSAGTVFNVTFPFLNNEEYVRVWYRDSKQEKKELILDTDYTVEFETGVNNIYGTIVLTKEIKDLRSISIERRIENDQDVNFTSDTLYSSTTEYALDKLTGLVQDMNFKNYTLRAPSDEKLENNEAYELPSTVERVNKVLGFGNDGLPKLYNRIEGGSIYPATRTSLGMVMIGDSLDIDEVGMLNAPVATEERAGILKKYTAGENVTISNDNVISAKDTKYILPKADENTLGGIKVGENLSIDANGILSGMKGEKYTGGDNININNTNEISVVYSDTDSWTSTTMPSSEYWRSICYGDGKYVALAFSTSKAAYSYDGINWTSTTMPSSSDWYSVCYGDNKYVAVSGNNYRGAVAIGSIENVLTRILQKIG